MSIRLKDSHRLAEILPAIASKYPLPVSLTQCVGRMV